MSAIFKKEMLKYFKTPIAYIFMAPFIAFAALNFVVGLFSYESVSVNNMLNYILGSINIMCLFIVPILTMQLLSEERNKKTDQLLLTAPVSVWDIVTGKYLAALSVFFITFVISLIFPIILFIIGKPILSEVIGSYLGFFLIWATFIAIGIFISSVTENQVISAILTFVVLLVLYSMDGFISGISQPVIKSVLGWFSIFRRFADFQVGLINLPNVIYYLSFIFVFLFLTQRNIEKRRYS